MSIDDFEGFGVTEFVVGFEKPGRGRGKESGRKGEDPSRGRNRNPHREARENEIDVVPLGVKSVPIIADLRRDDGFRELVQHDSDDGNGESKSLDPRDPGVVSRRTDLGLGDESALLVATEMRLDPTNESWNKGCSSLGVIEDDASSGLKVEEELPDHGLPCCSRDGVGEGDDDLGEFLSVEGSCEIGEDVGEVLD